MTGQGGKHRHSSTTEARPGPERIQQGSPTEIAGNILGRKHKDEGEHTDRDLTGVGGNGVRTQVLTTLGIRSNGV